MDMLDVDNDFHFQVELNEFMEQKKLKEQKIETEIPEEFKDQLNVFTERRKRKREHGSVF